MTTKVRGEKWCDNFWLYFTSYIYLHHFSTCTRLHLVARLYPLLFVITVRSYEEPHSQLAAITTWRMRRLQKAYTSLTIYIKYVVGKPINEGISALVALTCTAEDGCASTPIAPSCKCGILVKIEVFTHQIGFKRIFRAYRSIRRRWGHITLI